MARVIEKVVLSTTQPKQANVVWAKPNANGKITFKIPVTENTYRNVSVEELVEYDIVQLSEDIKDLKGRTLEVKKEIKDEAILYKLYYDTTFVSDIEVPFDKVIESTDYNTETNTLTIKIANTEDVVTIDFNKMFEDLFQTSALYIDPNEYTREQLFSLATQNKLIPGKKYICTNIIIGQECESSEDIVIDESTGKITVNNLKNIYAKGIVEYKKNESGYPLDFSPLIKIVKDANSDYMALTPAVPEIWLEYDFNKNEILKFHCGTFTMGKNNIILNATGVSFLRMYSFGERSNTTIANDNTIIFQSSAPFYNSVIGNNNNLFISYIEEVTIGNSNKINLVGYSSYMSKTYIDNANYIKGFDYLYCISIGSVNTLKSDNVALHLEYSIFTTNTTMVNSSISNYSDYVYLEPSSALYIKESYYSSHGVRFVHLKRGSTFTTHMSYEGNPLTVIDGEVIIENEASFGSISASISYMKDTTITKDKLDNGMEWALYGNNEKKYDKLYNKSIINNFIKGINKNGELVIISDFV